MDESGVLWFGYTENRIARIDGRGVQLLDSKQGLQVGNVLAILAEDGELWVGGELGFARFDGKRFVPVPARRGRPFEARLGNRPSAQRRSVVERYRWASRTSRAASSKRLVRDPAHRAESETFNYLDGVPGTAMQLRPQPSAIETTDGRIWFAMTGGIVSIDPSQLARKSLPPPVTIWSLTSGDERHTRTWALSCVCPSTRPTADRIQRRQPDRAGARALPLQARRSGSRLAGRRGPTRSDCTRIWARATTRSA